MLDKDNLILFQGDSITDCGRSREAEVANVGLGSGYANMIATDLLARKPEMDLRFFNRGISGNRVVDLYARWKIDALHLKPNVLSLLVGVNDIWHEFSRQNGVGPERFDQFYRMILDWTKKELPEITLVLCEPFVLVHGAVDEKWVPVIKERQVIVKKIAEDYKTIFVPFQSVYDRALEKAPASYWVTDGVHPTQAGHRIMADTWLEAVGASF